MRSLQAVLVPLAPRILVAGLLVACPEPLVTVAVDAGIAGEGEADARQGEDKEGEGEGEGDGDGEGEGEGEREGEGTVGEGEVEEGEDQPGDGEGERGQSAGEGEGENEPSEGGEEGEGEGDPDPCVGLLNDFENGALQNGALGWSLDDAATDVVDGEARVTFVRPALCSGRPGLSQSVFVPDFCGPLGPALEVTGFSGLGEFPRLDPEIDNRASNALNVNFADGRRVLAGSAPRCHGDAQLGRAVLFRLSGAIFPTEADDCESHPSATVAVRHAHLSLEACPRPGQARPFSAWRPFNTGGTTTVRADGALVMKTVAGCDTAQMVGPSAGTASVPGAFEHPALVVRGHKSPTQPRSFTVTVDDLPLDNLDGFDDAVVCLPDEKRGNVIDVRLRLMGFRLGCVPNPQQAIIEGLEIVDDPRCTSAAPPPAHWTGFDIIDDDEAGVTVDVTSCPNLFHIDTFAQAPPAGSRAALRIRYAAERDVDVYLTTTAAGFLPSTDGVVVEADRCIDVRLAGQVFPVSFYPRMRFANDGGPGSECVHAAARFEAVDVVENQDCAPLL